MHMQTNSYAQTIIQISASTVKYGLSLSSFLFIGFDFYSVLNNSIGPLDWTVVLHTCLCNVVLNTLNLQCQVCCKSHNSTLLLHVIH